MTIKKQGGIFGRNPSFNSVNAESATFNNDVTFNEDILMQDAKVLRSAGQIVLQRSDGANYIRLGSSNASDYLRLFAGGEEKWRVNSAGNLVVQNSGNGIDFSATAGTGTSELFDDYEEGTWTPTVTGLTVVGTPTYTGRYTKLGRLVNFDLRIEATTSTAATSGVTVFSLPFVQAGEPRSYAICSEGSPPTGPILTSYVYPPTWSATQSVWICGTYSV